MLCTRSRMVDVPLGLPDSEPCPFWHLMGGGGSFEGRTVVCTAIELLDVVSKLAIFRNSCQSRPEDCQGRDFTFLYTLLHWSFPASSAASVSLPRREWLFGLVVVDVGLAASFREDLVYCISNLIPTSKRIPSSGQKVHVN